MPTVDGPRWVEERLRFLRELLEQDREHEHRDAIEAEIEKLRASQRGRLPRWLRFPRLPHQH